MARHWGQYRVDLVDTHGLLRAIAAARRRELPAPKVNGGYRALYRFMHKAAASAGLSLAARAKRAAVSGSIPASHSRRCTSIVAFGISALPPT